VANQGQRSAETKDQSAEEEVTTLNKRKTDEPDDENYRRREFKGISQEEVQVWVAREIENRLAQLDRGDGGVTLDVAGQKATIWGRNTPMLLLVLGLVSSVGVLVWDSREARKQTHQQWVRMSQQFMYDHEKISYERREDRCILLFDPAERKTIRAVLNAGGNPFRFECSWLGNPPMPPMVHP
jgi:hypothetical protein